MIEASVSVAGNLTDDPELRHTEGGIARAAARIAAMVATTRPWSWPTGLRRLGGWRPAHTVG